MDIVRWVSDLVGGRRRRYRVIRAKAPRLGSTLDVVITAQELADVACLLGERAVVYLAQEVFDGEEPPPRYGAADLALQCAALAPAEVPWPDRVLRPGGMVPPMPNTDAVRAYQVGEPHLIGGLDALYEALVHDPASIECLVPYDTNPVWCLFVPLVTRGHVLGSVQIWWRRRFTARDIQVARELVSPAALSVDAARRHTHERELVLKLQRSLLPCVPRTPAAEIATGYEPASLDAGGASGDWYDAIPVSSLRVVLVVGDVVGHGLDAAVTMGWMRAVVQTLAAQDQPPDELLAHLDERVLRLAEQEQDGDGPTGSTCCVCVFDPVDRTLSIASAGHPPPFLIRPDGTVSTIALEPGPPLGVGGQPFSLTTITVEPDSVIVLYSDGLVEDRTLDIEAGMQLLREQLVGLTPDSELKPISRALMANAPGHWDDVTLLMARVTGVPTEDVIAWNFPVEETAASAARNAVATQLTECWGAPENLVDTARIVVSELVTNAVRYAGGAYMTVRLIRDDDKLIIEVADFSSNAPRPRLAGWFEESGRGLLIIAQVTGHWGVRYRPGGKTIWTELFRGAPAPDPVAAFSSDLEELEGLEDLASDGPDPASSSP